MSKWYARGLLPLVVVAFVIGFSIDWCLAKKLDTLASTNGLKGSPGATGPQGPQGIPGVCPSCVPTDADVHGGDVTVTADVPDVGPSPLDVKPPCTVEEAVHVVTEYKECSELTIDMVQPMLNMECESLKCWDKNKNGECDHATEDDNRDGGCTLRDCCVIKKLELKKSPPVLGVTCPSFEGKNRFCLGPSGDTQSVKNGRCPTDYKCRYKDKPPIRGSEDSLNKCHDGIDNDNDGRIDCNDPDCNFYCENTPQRCSDGKDNDGDRAIDCDDSECLRFPEVCPPDPGKPPQQGISCVREANDVNLFCENKQTGKHYAPVQGRCPPGNQWKCVHEIPSCVGEECGCTSGCCDCE